jgi:ribosomal protein L40E
MPTKILDGLDATSPLHDEGPPLEKSSTPPLQCLFCKHFNPPGASFCNDCGSQLNLQPCDQCGAIDNRAAKNCYKCGAEFTLPAAPGLDAPLAPAILENRLTYPALNNANLAAPQAKQAMDGTVSSEMGAMSTGSRRRTLIAVPALLLALLAASVYFYYEPSKQLPPKQDIQQPVPTVSAAPMPAESTPPVVAAQVDTDLPPTNTIPKLATTTVAPEKAPALAPPGVDTALTVRLPSATVVEVNTRKDPLIFEECPQAVATLGLCNPDPKQEK